MSPRATVNGLVFVRAEQDTSMGNGPLVYMDSNAKVTGALHVMIDIGGNLGLGHKIMSLNSNAHVLYSSEVIGKVLGDAASSSQSELTNVMSIRLK